MASFIGNMLPFLKQAALLGSVFFLGVLAAFGIARLRNAPRVLYNIGLCVAVLIAGFVGMKSLAALRHPPAAADTTERPIPVQAVTVQPEDLQVTIRGWGQVRSLDTVQVVPEVPGTIVEVHPNLEVGQVIPAGEMMFVIDPRTYEAGVQQAQGQVAQIEKNIEQLTMRMASDTQRLETATRSLELAKADHERVKGLFEKDEVGTLSGVEGTERVLNQAQDAVDQMQQAVDLYPVLIREARAGLESARAALSAARVNLDRTRIAAPFNARVTMHTVEVGQYVAPGAPVMAIANDAVLEITVPIDSQDATQWLRFAGGPPVENAAWFPALEKIECQVRWTEDKGDHAWKGRLDRVQQFSSNTKQVYLAIRIEGADAFSADSDRLPLVDGMFCEVAIPGRTLKGVYRVPEWAVSAVENTVYRVVDSRLQTTQVQVTRSEGEYKYVSDGLSPGDQVVVTRLMSPIEGTLLSVSESGEKAVDSANVEDGQ